MTLNSYEKKKALVTGLVLASVIFAAGCNLSSNSANTLKGSAGY